jgi:hypothetical protein
LLAPRFKENLFPDIVHSRFAVSVKCFRHGGSGKLVNMHHIYETGGIVADLFIMIKKKLLQGTLTPVRKHPMNCTIIFISSMNTSLLTEYVAFHK